MLAPEEVANKPRADIKSTSERTDTDRKRERRQKKKGQGLKQRHQATSEKLKNMQPGLGNKYSKLAVLKARDATKKDNLSSAADVKRKETEKLTKNAFKSSKSFFAKLQDEVHGAKKEKVVKPLHSSKSLML